MDLPTEVIEKGLFPFLMHNELKRMKLNRRLKDIADSVIEIRDRKCKHKLQGLMHDKYNITLLVFTYPISNYLFLFRYQIIDSRWE